MNIQDFKQVTDGCVNGKGVFDELMKSVKAHLKEEYDAQRIRGSEYSNVYIASIQMAMQQSIEWVLRSEIAKNEALLLEQQIETQAKQVQLVVQQVEQAAASTDLTNAQVANTIAEGALIPKQGLLLDEQIQAAITQTALATQQRLTEIENTATANYNLTTMLPSQRAILDQKLITEQGQTQDVSVNGTIKGHVGAQRDLLKKQTDGFDRDAEQRAARTLIDAFGIAVASDLEGGPDAISGTNISSALNVLRINGGLGPSV